MLPTDLLLSVSGIYPYRGKAALELQPGGRRKDAWRAVSHEGDINLAGAELVREGGFWTLTVPGLGEVELVARRMTPLRLEAGVTAGWNLRRFRAGESPPGVAGLRLFPTERTSHPLACQLPMRDRSRSEQPGSRRIPVHEPPSVPDREKIIPT
jgi:hypothetical protein